MENSEIVKFLRDNPGAIAEEIGATSVEMNRAFKEGMVIKLGTRKMNRRGRPPVEWAVPGTVGVKQDERVSEALAHAQQRVEDHRRYERDASHLSHVRMTFGMTSQEYQEAKADHKDRWPMPPVLPSQNDYALMGAIVDLDEMPVAA